MCVRDAVVNRVCELCRTRGITINELANLSGMTPSAVYSLLNPKCRQVSINTIKKLCDGLEISLGEFFTTSEFDSLEQEIE